MERAGPALLTPLRGAAGHTPLVRRPSGLSPRLAPMSRKPGRLSEPPDQTQASTRQPAMKRNYPGKPWKDPSPGAQAVYERLKAPFVRRGPVPVSPVWALPAAGLQAGFWADNIRLPSSAPQGLCSAFQQEHASTNKSLL